MKLEPWHVVVLLVLVLVLFGYKRLPDAARSMGRSMRIFKSEIDTMRDDSKSSDDKKSPEGQTEPLSGRIVDEPPAPRAATEKSPDERR